MFFAANDNCLGTDQTGGIVTCLKYEPRCEKIGLRGFRPGLTQIRLYNDTRWLETGNFIFRKKKDCTICVAKTKVLISCTDTAQLICVFVFANAKKPVFS